MKNVIFRQLTVEDAPIFHQLRAQSLEINPEAYGMGLIKWQEAPLSSVEALIEASASGQDGPLIGAFSKQELLGYAGVKVVARKKVSHLGTLWGLFVRPESRRQGIARELIKALLSKSKEKEGLEQIRLMVSTESKAALALFEATGFENYGMEPRGRKLGDKYLDMVYMWRMLDS
ncbi:MAG: GNAT family N-acetyltransferase [Planctomycetota bacterium]|nr:GNAT family N-acetyltransferase [Planctomycetota bacterium]